MGTAVLMFYREMQECTGFLVVSHEGTGNEEKGVIWKKK